MISEEEYQLASKQKEAAQEVINQFFKEKRERFQWRLLTNPIFTDDELRYSAASSAIRHVTAAH